jgi:hypothetical protein
MRKSGSGPKDPNGAFGIGSRVRTTDESHCRGEIVDDFGEMAGMEVVIAEGWTAKARRWAVALEDGRVVFLDDDGIEPRRLSENPPHTTEFRGIGVAIQRMFDVKPSNSTTSQALAAKLRLQRYGSRG